MYDDLPREHGNVTVKDFRKYENLDRYLISQQLQTTWCVYEIPYL